MEDNGGFFGWLGGAVGGAIHAIVDLLRAVFGGLAGAIGDFLRGVSRAVGMDDSIFNYLWLALGILMLVAAVRAIFRRAFLAAIVWAVLGVFVLGGLVR